MEIGIQSRNWDGYENPDQNYVLYPAALALPKNTIGYLLLIGSQEKRDAAVYFGFAPVDGVGDLLRLVQFGNPDPLAILAFIPAKMAEVEDQLRAFKDWRCRPDGANWLIRSDAVLDYVKRLRESMLEAQIAAVEADELEEVLMPVVTSKPIKRPNQRTQKTKQRRPRNNRRQKPRWL
jgi:hypothetical protein